MKKCFIACLLLKLRQHVRHVEFVVVGIEVRHTDSDIVTFEQVREEIAVLVIEQSL